MRTHPFQTVHIYREQKVRHLEIAAGISEIRKNEGRDLKREDFFCKLWRKPSTKFLVSEEFGI